MLRRLILALAAALTILLPLVHLSPAAALASGPPFRTWLPLTVAATPQPPVISAFCYDGFASGDADEGFQVYNPNPYPIDLVGWQVSSGARVATFPTVIVPARGAIWCGREALAFRRTFGVLPACEWGADTSSETPNLTGGALQLANTGGRLSLSRPGGSLVDAVVYKAGSASQAGWQGESIKPYAPTSALSEKGQVLYRKLDERTALPLPDTDTAADWSGDRADALLGRRVRYGGWSFERFFFPAQADELARVQVVVAPDATYEALAQSLWAAKESIAFEGFTFESSALAAILADQARAGVRVTVLLEGAPPGGVSDQQRWCVQHMAQAGGRIYYMVADSAAGIHDRYQNQHAKLWLLDSRAAIVSSENPSLDSFPNDPKSDGTLGRRGAYIATDAPGIVRRAGEIMEADMDSSSADILAFDPAHPTLGAPPPDFAPVFDSGGTRYPAKFARPLELTARLKLELCQAPEQSMRREDCLLGLVARAGAGDTLLIEQLQEPPYWGPNDGTVESDPNPRLEAYIAAARRGATVRLLLDAYFDDLSSTRSNLRTQEYVAAVARAEGIDVEVRRGNPAGLGLHNKMVLAEIDGEGHAMIGSLNGGEASAKVNREVSLIVRSNEVHQYLAAMFWSDWGSRPSQNASFATEQVAVE